MNGSMKACIYCALVLLIAAPVFAAGPIDGEVGAVWWANDLETSGTGGSASADGSAPGFRAELWAFNRYGFRAMQYTSDTDTVGSAEADYTSIDLMWRPISPSENNFFAVGLGWEKVDLGSIGTSTDTSGARLAVEGRIGFIDMVYGYGTGSYAPALDDATNSAADAFEDLQGYEYELGVGWDIAPFISARGGYRVASTDFTQVATAGIPTPPADGNVESTGFFAGVGFHF